MWWISQSNHNHHKEEQKGCQCLPLINGHLQGVNWQERWKQDQIAIQKSESTLQTIHIEMIPHSFQKCPSTIPQVWYTITSWNR